MVFLISGALCAVLSMYGFYLQGKRRGFGFNQFAGIAFNCVVLAGCAVIVAAR